MLLIKLHNGPVFTVVSTGDFYLFIYRLENPFHLNSALKAHYIMQKKIAGKVLKLPAIAILNPA